MIKININISIEDIADLITESRHFNSSNDKDDGPMTQEEMWALQNGYY